jgi:hypothetical protein
MLETSSERCSCHWPGQISGLPLADGFDTVTVRVENKRRVIIITVFGMYPRPAVVFSAMLQCSPVKRAHGLTGRRGKSDVKTLTGYSDMSRAKFDGELIIIMQRPVPNGCLVCPDAGITQRSKDSIVKSAGALKVSNSE